MIAKYHPFSIKKFSQFFPQAPLKAPAHYHLQGGKGVLTRLKKRLFFNTFFSYSHSALDQN